MPRPRWTPRRGGRFARGRSPPAWARDRPFSSRAEGHHYPERRTIRVRAGMNLKTQTEARSVSGAAKGGASAIRDCSIERGPGVEGARKQPNRTIAGAQKQARSTVKDAPREARRQLVQARIAAAKARSRTQTKASGLSGKAVGAAGGGGGASAGSLLPQSGRRRG